MASRVGQWQGRVVFFFMAAAMATASSEAIVPRKGEGGLQAKRRVRLDLGTAPRNVPLSEVMDQLPNRAAWEAFAASRLAEGWSPAQAFVDPASGTATGITTAVPLIPGRGAGNDVTLGSLGRTLGRAVKQVDAAAVAEATIHYVRAQSAILGVDTAQLGPVRASRVTTDLWQVSFPQQYRGIPVRNARLGASIGHGNLVLIGTSGWANVALPDVTPALSAEAALEKGFAYAEGRTAEDDVVQPPVLQILAAASVTPGATNLAVGRGFTHRLVWTFVFQRRPAVERWEVMVDAKTGEVQGFQDLNEYVKRHVTGGVYPVTNTETCPDNSTCGVMQGSTPMPFANTGLPAPNDFTNSAGVFDFTAGSAAATTLNGRFVTIHTFNDPLSEAAVGGAISLGGTNGQHDFEASGTSPGNTPAARTAFYELNKIMEIARGYLPFNPNLVGAPLDTFVNESSGGEVCNAYYTNPPDFPPFPPTPPSIHFFVSGSDTDFPEDVCRNTGEMGQPLDHEWGHWLDDFDAEARSSGPGEAYADIASLYRNQTSCLGPGFFVNNSDDCGSSPDGTGENVDMGLFGPPHCATQCSGVREADWAKHSPNTPDDILGFGCSQCIDFSHGDVFIEPHCLAAPVDQAAWDFVARDLRGQPFNLDSQAAFLVANKTYYQGSGAIFNWFAFGRNFCDEVSNGCDSDSGYKQWLMADDDNGNLNDGTPHMTAIYNAFDRHGLACSTDPPQRINSGCAAGPSVAPTLTVGDGPYKVTLNWTAVPGATRYWVFRSEGHAGCDYGKALIAEVSGLTFTDTEVAAARVYYYNVVAAGTSSACYSKPSTCQAAAPDFQDYRITCAPSSITNSAPATCTVQSLNEFAGPVKLGCVEMPGTATCVFSPGTVDVPANGSATTTLTVSSGVTPPGVYTLRILGSLPARAGGENVTTIGWTLTDASGGTGTIAAYDAARHAPRCGALSRSCDSGTSLLRGRGTLTPEPNQPNTVLLPLQPACVDGSGTLFPNDRFPGSNDRIMVYTVDGSALAAGKLVRVDATVTGRASLGGIGDTVDFYATGDGTSGTWTFLGSRVPQRIGSQMISITYTLPAGGAQAVRVQLRHGGTRTACTAGPYNDHDDLIFPVGR